jgi:GNAT superfamily N-acetyltransferase
VIRTATRDDWDALYDVGLRCGDAGQDATALFDDPRLIGEVYVGPYLALEPRTCLTLDLDGPAGYALGTPDTVAFAARAEREWWPPLRARYPIDVVRRDADAALVAELFAPPTAPADVVAAYPAHLHIDLLPQGRGHGWGRLLIDELCDRLASAGATGVHLTVASSNLNAIGFYERLGFETVARLEDADVMALPLG